MKPRITILTLGVNDLQRALEFYRDGLGWETEGIVGEDIEYGEVVFFELKNGLKFALFPRKNLAHDVGIAETSPSPTEFSFGHNVNSREEVDAIMDRAKKAGATIVKPAQKPFWEGYAGYFQDPDGHLWEIAYNPSWDKIEY